MLSIWDSDPLIPQIPEIHTDCIDPPWNTNVREIRILPIYIDKQHYSDATRVLSLSWGLKSLATQVFVEQLEQANTKETIKILHYWLVDSPYKGPVYRKHFHTMTSSRIFQIDTSILIHMTHNWKSYELDNGLSSIHFSVPSHYLIFWYTYMHHQAHRTAETLQ